MAASIIAADFCGNEHCKIQCQYPSETPQGMRGASHFMAGVPKSAWFYDYVPRAWELSLKPKIQSPRPERFWLLVEPF
jgi:hypothetical protein